MAEIEGPGWRAAARHMLCLWHAMAPTQELGQIEGHAARQDSGKAGLADEAEGFPYGLTYLAR